MSLPVIPILLRVSVSSTRILSHSLMVFRIYASSFPDKFLFISLCIFDDSFWRSFA